MIQHCRSCDGKNLMQLVSLGDQYLSDFRTDTKRPPAFPLQLILCQDCFLVQLSLTTPSALLYTDAYGFKSGINGTIKKDLADIVAQAELRYPLQSGDVVIDIGANDGTLLSYYTNKGKLHVIAVDPVKKFKEESQQHADVVIDDYFSARSVLPYLNNRRANIITSISMFYDLDDPNSFVSDITKVLDPRGIWVIQQNYLLSMLKQNAYDNIVHEHIEYYSLLSLKQLLRRHGLDIFDVQLNSINGGSFRTYVCFAGKRKISPLIAKLEQEEIHYGLQTPRPYVSFGRRIERLAGELHVLVSRFVKEGKKIYLYGASTRGNTLLQFSGLDHSLITAAVERNPEKWGKRIASVQIPIISEEEARKNPCDYGLLLPWFFADEITKREEAFLKQGHHFIVPLPELRTI